MLTKDLARGSRFGRAATMLMLLAVLGAGICESEYRFDRGLARMERITFESSSKNAGVLRRDFFGVGKEQELRWSHCKGRAKWDTFLYEFSGAGIEDATVLLYTSDASVATGLWLDGEGLRKRIVVYQPLFVDAGKLTQEAFPPGFWELNLESGKIVHRPLRTFFLSLWTRNLWPFSS